jgi:uncharacterized protein YndB with AHSA1/START domain
MSVISVDKDPVALTLTINAEYAAPIERVWALWEDPRLLEQWWGPPTYPATMVDHDLTPGGKVRYYMTGPEGDKAPAGGACSRSIRRTTSHSRTELPTTRVSPWSICRS